LELSSLLATHGDDSSSVHDHNDLPAQVGPVPARAYVQTHYIDGAPFEFTWDPAFADAAPDTAQPLAAASSSLHSLDSIPQLHSNPASTAALFLDFDGHFESRWGTYRNVTTPVFDQDNDPTTFSDGELASMLDIWTVVSEDYVPFNIDVTTVQPASFAN